MRTFSTGIIALSIATILLFPGFVQGSDPPEGTEMGPTGAGPYFEPGLVHTLYGSAHLGALREIVPSYPTDMDSRYWIVQFGGTIDRDASTTLMDLGYRVMGYLPDNAYIVRSPDGAPPNPSMMDGIKGTTPYLSGLKVHPMVHDAIMAEGRALTIMGAEHLVIDLFQDEESAHREIDIASPRAVHEGNRVLVHLPLADPDALLSIDGIRSVEPAFPVVLMNNVSTGIIGVETAWSDIGLSGKGQMVAIADTGLDTGVDNHSVDGDIMADFDNRVTFANWAGTSPDDTHSHGTHVSGSVAGNGSLSNGDIKGMAPEAEIFFQGIANDAGGLAGIPSNLSLLFKQAYDAGARIHTNSWGSSVAGMYTTSSRDVDWFLYHYPDMIVLFSAGNSGVDWFPQDGVIDQDSIGSPATSKDCITVGAGDNLRSIGYQNTWVNWMGYKWTGSSYVYTSKYPNDPIASDTPSDDPTGMAAFSSRGPTDDGRLKPDVFAPGTNILSTRSTKTTSTGWGTFSGNSNYIFMGGTSMSTPITAGALALIREYYNVTLGMDSPSGSLLKATLINGAQDMTPGQYGTGATQEIASWPDHSQGWGRINITNSLEPVGRSMTFLDITSGIVTGENITTSFTVSGGDRLDLTLAWSDYPGETSAAYQLVNDIDLFVIAPNGTWYRGNDMTSPYNDTSDRRNPVEGVHISNPATGTWKVVISGYNIPMGPQHLSLVASGDISGFSGIVRLSEQYYSTSGDDVMIELFDPDLVGSATVDLNVSSDSLPKGRTVRLSETGTSGRFIGSIRTHNASTTNVSLLPVSHDDTIRARYTDSSPSVAVDATAIAKDPQRILLGWMPEYGLVHSEHERLELHGRGQVGIDARWTLDGAGIGWRVLHDDGNWTHMDAVADDGNYSYVFHTPSDMLGTYPIMVRVEDEFLGTRYYEEYPIEFNWSVPRFPRNLTSAVRPEGNSVDLSWDGSNETDLANYTLYMMETSGLRTGNMTGWTALFNTTGVVQTARVSGLTDGTVYRFTLVARDIMGKTSSAAVPVMAEPQDTASPVVDIMTPSHTIVGIVRMAFSGDPDLALVEAEYYNDTNGNSYPDDDNEFLPMGTMPPDDFTWDSRAGMGGPGDLAYMIIRYRGYDEVPNISPYRLIGGFAVDNTGPTRVMLAPPVPARVTNEPEQMLYGTSEPNGQVEIWLNGDMVLVVDVDGDGDFWAPVTLIEGPNTVNLSAYDEFGAGPTNASYNFTLDTAVPAAIIDDGATDRTLEIGHEGIEFVSNSYDTGMDPEFVYLENITWTLRSPQGAEIVRYGVPSFIHNFVELGNHTLEIQVRDPAWNQNKTSVVIRVTDTTGPLVNISGTFTVDEDIAVRFDTSGTYDNDPLFRSREGSSFGWLFTGRGEWNATYTTETVYISFDTPGTYQVTLTATDGAGNTAGLTRSINVTDVTSPFGNIIGPEEPVLGVPVVYRANVTDNDPDSLDAISLSWNLSYREGTPSEYWYYELEGDTLEYNFTLKGYYYLTLRAVDRTGNSRDIGLSIIAIGDITPPTILEMSPEENASMRFPQDQIFTVRFSEPMLASSITNATIYLLVDGTRVDCTIEMRDDGTRAVVGHPPLVYGATYVLVVEPTATDLWGNRLGSGTERSYTIRTPFVLLFPEKVFPNSTKVNFSKEQNISLEFSNPVLPSAMLFKVEAYTKEGVETVPVYAVQGDAPNRVLLVGTFDDGVRYKVTIFVATVDIWGYELATTYTWDFKTYLPPTIQPPVDGPEDEGDPFGWSYLLFIALGIVLVLLLIGGILLRVRQRSRLKKLWNEGAEKDERNVQDEKANEELRRRIEYEMAQAESAPKEVPDTPAPPSYEDLYGSAPAEPVGGASSSFLDYETGQAQDGEANWDEEESPAGGPEEESWD